MGLHVADSLWIQPKGSIHKTAGFGSVMFVFTLRPQRCRLVAGGRDPSLKWDELPPETLHHPVCLPTSTSSHVRASILCGSHTVPSAALHGTKAESWMGSIHKRQGFLVTWQLSPLLSHQGHF